MSKYPTVDTTMSKYPTVDTTMSKYPTVDTTGIYAKFDWHGLCSSILNWFM
jgi:hypothetical protein